METQLSWEDVIKEIKRWFNDPDRDEEIINTVAILRRTFPEGIPASDAQFPQELGCSRLPIGRPAVAGGAVITICECCTQCESGSVVMYVPGNFNEIYQRLQGIKEYLECNCYKVKD